MPFLRAALIASKHNSLEGDLLGIRNVKSNDEDTQIKISFPISEEDEASLAKENHNKKKGIEYELFIGHIYENYGYAVEYNGIQKGGRDGGIDLICHSKRYTILVQCKCYEASNSNIGVNDIYKFYGAFRHYAIKHPKEVVQGAFWTSREIDENAKVFEAAVELGITLHDGVAKSIAKVSTKKSLLQRLLHNIELG